MKQDEWTPPEIMTTDDLARYLGVSLRTVRRIISDKEIPAQKVGRAWKIRKDLVDVYISGQDPFKVAEERAH